MCTLLLMVVLAFVEFITSTEIFPAGRQTSSRLRSGVGTGGGLVGTLIVCHCDPTARPCSAAI